MVRKNVVQTAVIALLASLFTAGIAHSDEPRTITVRRIEIRQVEGKQQKVEAGTAKVRLQRKSDQLAEPEKLQRPATAKATWQGKALAVEQEGQYELRFVDENGKAHSIVIPQIRNLKEGQGQRIMIWLANGKTVTARVVASDKPAIKVQTAIKLQPGKKPQPAAKLQPGKKPQPAAKLQRVPNVQYRVIRTLPDGKPVVVARALPAAEFQLGIQLAAVGAALRSQLQLKEGQGVLVAGVLPASAAAKAGLQQHDLIVAVNGTALAGAEQLIKHVRASAGKALVLTFLRAGKKKQVKLAAGQPAVPGARQGVYQFRLAPQPQGKKPASAKQGDKAARLEGPAAQLQAVLKSLNGQLPEEVRKRLAATLNRELGNIELELGEGQGTIELRIEVEDDGSGPKVERLETRRASPSVIVIPNRPAQAADNPADDRERQIKLLQQQLNRLQKAIEELNSQK